MDRLTRAVARAILTSPGALRELARRVGQSHVQLLRISRGERRATPATAAKVARVLAEWGAACQSAVRGIQQAARQLGRKR